MICKPCEKPRANTLKPAVIKGCPHLLDDGTNCGKRSTFNVIDEKPLYCGKHKSKGMINGYANLCNGFNGDGTRCYEYSVYNFPEKKAAFCVKHKTDGMNDVISKKCDNIDELGIKCNTSVSYGYPGKSKTKCSKHQLTGMANLKHPSCNEPGCNQKRSYGFPKDNIITHCSKHKKTDMVNLKHKMCEECKKTRKAEYVLIASYNYDGETSPRFCKEHKLDGMDDVTHQRCDFKGGEFDCKRRPLYNVYTETKPRFCVEHKTVEMIDVANKKCLSSWCLDRSYSSSYEGYCLRCFVHLFPDKKIARNYKTKEKAVSDFILDKFSNMSWISDKRIIDGCSKRRPDLFLDLGYQIIVIEVDENQHVNYDCSCENKRLMEISQDVGHRSIVFVRFNPDQYVNKDGIKINTCWTINKSTKLLCVSKANDKEWTNRLNSLMQQVQYWLDNKSEKMVEIVQLFYDEC